MQVAYWPPLMICYMAFTIKGQTKAAAATVANKLLHTKLEQKPSKLESGSSWPPVEALLYGVQHWATFVTQWNSSTP